MSYLYIRWYQILSDIFRYYQMIYNIIVSLEFARSPRTGTPRRTISIASASRPEISIDRIDIEKNLTTKTSRNVGKMSKFHWSHWTSTRFEDFGWIPMKFHDFTSFVLCSSLLLLCIIHLLYIYMCIYIHIYIYIHILICIYIFINAYWCHGCPIQMPRPCFFVLRRSRYSWQPVENRWWQQLHCLHDSRMTAAWQHYKHLFVKEFPTHHMDTTWTPHAMAESCGICLPVGATSLRQSCQCQKVCPRLKLGLDCFSQRMAKEMSRELKNVKESIRSRWKL